MGDQHDDKAEQLYAQIELLDRARWPKEVAITYISTALRSTAEAMRDAALDEAAEVARSCGNGEQELWDPWETGYRFAREDIAKVILALKRADPTTDPRDAAMKLARDGLKIISATRGIGGKTTWEDHVDAMRRLALSILAAIDAAMKPQESSHD